MKRTLPSTATLFLLAMASALAIAGDAGNGYRHVEGGDFRSSVRFEETTRVVRVASFSLMARPVSNREFAGFVARQPANASPSRRRKDSPFPHRRRPRRARR